MQTLDENKYLKCVWNILKKYLFANKNRIFDSENMYIKINWSLVALYEFINELD